MAGTLVRIEGLRGLDAALAELGKRLAGTVLYRTLEKVGGPIRDDMKAKAPGEGPTKDSIRMIRASAERSRLGKAAYANSLRGGGSVGEARGALRSTMSELKAGAAFAEVIIGPGRMPQAIWAEFGTGERFHKSGKSVGSMQKSPYARPAWDDHSGQLVGKIAAELRQEIDKAAARVAARTARQARG